MGQRSQWVSDRRALVFRCMLAYRWCIYFKFRDLIHVSWLITGIKILWCLLITFNRFVYISVFIPFSENLFQVANSPIRNKMIFAIPAIVYLDVNKCTGKIISGLEFLEINKLFCIVCLDLDSVVNYIIFFIVTVFTVTPDPIISPSSALSLRLSPRLC